MKSENGIVQFDTAIIEQYIEDKNYDAIADLYENNEKISDEVRFEDPDGDLCTITKSPKGYIYERRTHRKDTDGVSDGVLNREIYKDTDGEVQVDHL